MIELRVDVVFQLHWMQIQCSPVTEILPVALAGACV